MTCFIHRLAMNSAEREIEVITISDGDESSV